MARKMIAKAVKGAEFLYSRDSAHLVSNASANKICDMLNKLRWGLNDGEVWHVYDCGEYEIEYSAAAYRRFSIRKGCLYDSLY